MYEIAPLLDDPIHNLKTIRDLYRWAITEMETADLSYGHGSPDSWEEASFLICRALKLPFEHFEEFQDAALTHNELVRLVHLVDRRVHDKVPTAYLLKEAWLTGHRFYIDERALIPRSYIAELLEEDLAPWIEDPYAVSSVLDLCTGSGCLAILAAGVFPNAAVTGSDLSEDALEVAKINRRDYDLEDALELVRGDLFENLQGCTFDLIISNPPYVTTDSMSRLPSEYRHEPEMALGAGADGMDVVRRLLPEARRHLNDNGIIVVEVGDGLEAVEAAFPGLELTWLSVSGGDDQVFMATKAELDRYFGA
ncbi:50S ribosomal protein L3 N(5)-glutamine methyltransferase [Sutterella megalosphaeroides]|uniref:site-specific DNA-methyltransferase (adenine-specific) n=1 Tax=Sutterella megalosphaeroides TaxID=2494234 RepID=A0A2Z6I8Y5_9BURK|nr:50S ribosomal protein L3 N(5)-glutamine methyltransferase [Sutterella megalosphaeroides]BBF22869.1 50S ribosomal protein L3 glutamine methyltransferase [Sutterella megalosphaeroides]